MMKAMLLLIVGTIVFLPSGCSSPEQHIPARFGLTQQEYDTAMQCFGLVPGEDLEKLRIPTAQAFVRAQMTKKQVKEFIGANLCEEYDQSIQWHHGPGGGHYIEFQFDEHGALITVTDTVPGNPFDEQGAGVTVGAGERVVIAGRKLNNGKP